MDRRDIVVKRDQPGFPWIWLILGLVLLVGIGLLIWFLVARGVPEGCGDNPSIPVSQGERFWITNENYPNRALTYSPDNNATWILADRTDDENQVFHLTRDPNNRDNFAIYTETFEQAGGNDNVVVTNRVYLQREGAGLGSATLTPDASPFELSGTSWRYFDQCEALTSPNRSVKLASQVIDPDGDGIETVSVTTQGVTNGLTTNNLSSWVFHQI